MDSTEINKDQDCPVCNGDGYTAEHALQHGQNDECIYCPVQVLCEACKATGKTLQSSLNDPELIF